MNDKIICEYCLQGEEDVRRIEIIRKGYDQAFWACKPCRKYLVGWWKYATPGTTLRFPNKEPEKVTALKNELDSPITPTIIATPGKTMRGPALRRIKEFVEFVVLLRGPSHLFWQEHEGQFFRVDRVMLFRWTLRELDDSIRLGKLYVQEG